MRASLCLLSLLAACASPAPQFFGANRQELREGGIDFVVYWTTGRAEVVRMGYLARADRSAVPALMIRAAERASGCRAIPGSVITGLPGDTGEARFDLDCG